MLSIAHMTLGQQDYYLADYYKNGDEHGQGLGEGARSLGLAGKVDAEELTNLWHGRSPDGLRNLVRVAERKNGVNRVPATDLTVSVPKSVSVLWSQSDHRTRKAIERATWEAAKAVVNYYQSEARLARRGAGGRHREAADLVVSGFLHQTSRRNEPQLHVHLLVANVCLRKDGTTGAIDERELFRHKMAAGAIFRTQLAYDLRREVGVTIVEGVKGTFEIDSVPNTACDALSTRRKEIKAVLREIGATSAKAAEAVTLKTREKKAPKHSRDELFASWRVVGERHGFGPAQAARLAKKGVEPHQDLTSPTIAATRFVADLTRKQGHFAERDLVRAVAVEGQLKGWTAATVLAAKEAALSHRRVHRLADGERVSTKTQLNLERKLLAAADRMATITSHQISDEVQRATLRKFDSLSDEQRRAFDYLTGTAGAIKTVRGLPGTGKTTMLKAANFAWRRSGMKVVGVALSGKAAAELESGARIKSQTFERFFERLDRGRLYDQAVYVVDQFARAARNQPAASKNDALRLNSRTVVVIDEAAMATTRQIELVRRKVEKAGAQLVLTGDDRQLQSVEAGGSFSALHRKLQGAELREIRRQKHDWMRKAVVHASRGDARAALTLYAEHRRLDLARTQTEARRTLIIDWKRHRTKNLSKSIIIAGTNADVSRLNLMAQRLRKQRGELGALKQRIKGAWVYRGDRILVTQNSQKHGVRNGDLAKIVHIGLDTITLRLDRKVRIAGMLAPKHVKLKRSEYGMIQLGYAITSHKAQGATFERSFVLLNTDYQNRELSLVQLSRATDMTRLYSTKNQAGEDLSEMVKAMSRSHRKTLAVEHDGPQQRQESRVRM